MNRHEIDELLERRWGPRAVPPEIQAAIEHRVLGSLKPVKPLRGPGQFLAGFLVVFVAVLAVALSVKGLHSPRVMSGWQFGVVSLVLVVGVLGAASSLSRQVIPGARHWVSPRAVVVGVAAALVTVFAVLFPWRSESSLWSRGWQCTKFGWEWAIPTAVLFWWLLRQAVVLTPARTGATAGLLAGLVGATVVHLGCLNTTAPHLVVWHAAVPATGALAGFLLGVWGQRRA